MTDKILLVDDDLVVDFHKQWIEGRPKPRPKRPQFFSLATPIQINGELSDLGVGVAPGDVFGTLIRLATAYIVVPIQWIVLNKLPEDGTADCLQIMEPHKNRKRFLQVMNGTAHRERSYSLQKNIFT